MKAPGSRHSNSSNTVEDFCLQVKVKMASPIRVLQIEDNPADARLIRELIAEESSIGFTWENVERLSTAADILRVQPFDLVPLDISLPDRQGLETFNRLQPHALCLPIVVLTGLDNESVGM